MSRDIVYFDLETRRSAGDVGGWQNKGEMGISVAVTYSTKAGGYQIFQQDETDQLVDQLMAADLVVGYNHIHFDYEVVMAHTILDLKSVLHNFDILIELEKAAGFRPKLESVSQATLGVGKTAEGLEAIRWWRQGKMVEIAKYCCFDVKVTRCVHEYALAHGELKYYDRQKNLQTVALDWK